MYKVQLLQGQQITETQECAGRILVLGADARGKHTTKGVVRVQVVGSAIEILLLDARRAISSDAADDGTFAAKLGILRGLLWYVSMLRIKGRDLLGWLFDLK